MKNNKLMAMTALALASAMVLGACGGSKPAETTAAPAATTAAAAETTAAAAETTAAAAEAVKGGMEGGTSLNFTTGGDQGTYYGFGGVLAGKIGETTSTTVTAITSGGSKANIEALEMGDAQLGFVQSDVMAYGYNGTRLFEGAPVTNISTVAALYMEQVQIVTLDENIKSVADLKGKNVSIGAAGSGVYFNAIDVLGAYGLAESDINPTYQSFGDSTEALQDGKIDAAFIVAGAPTTAVTSLAATKPVHLVELDKEHIEKLLAGSPYYSENVIPKDAYGTEKDIRTVAVGAVVIANNDVSDVDVYNFLAGVYENIPAITRPIRPAGSTSLHTIA